MKEERVGSRTAIIEMDFELLNLRHSCSELIRSNYKVITWNGCPVDAMAAACCCCMSVEGVGGG